MRKYAVQKKYVIQTLFQHLQRTFGIHSAFPIRTGLSLLFFVLALFPSSAIVSFANLDLNADNEIVFTAEQNIPGVPVYNTLFRSSVQSKSPSFDVLTCFPEKLEITNEGSSLDIQNRYGKARYDFSSGSLRWLFKEENLSGAFSRIEKSAVSPNGKWLCYLKKTGNATGDLILKNIAKNTETAIASSIRFSYEKIPVKWAADSGILLYEHDNCVYFIQPEDAFNKMLLSENVRKIGKGTINSVAWTAEKHFFYINGDLIYKISENGLFTRALYSSLIGMGSAAGRLSYQFNPAEDCFWVNSKGNAIVLCQKKRIFTYARIAFDDFSYVTPISTIPFNDPKGTVYDAEVLWTPLSFDGSGEEKPIFWVNVISSTDGKLLSRVYKLDKSLQLITDVVGGIKPKVSPDGLLMAFTSEKNLYVYNLRTCTLKAAFKGERIFSFAWKDRTSLVAGGENTVRLFSLTTDTPQERILFLSSAENAFWDSNGKSVVALNSGKTYLFNSQKNVWQPYTADEKLSHTVQNGRYRVFTGESFCTQFANAVYVRTLTGSPANNIIFGHEKTKSTENEQAKRVAIVFDALDNAAGIPDILKTLDAFSLKATFFVNGEFVRRYPTELKQIIGAGHECASMFYTASDLTEQYGFVIDEDFIKRGLAREEDEFYDKTGSELALFWHAPFYKATAAMKKAAEHAGYTYIEADVHGEDNISFEDCYREKKQYLSVGDLVEKYMAHLHDTAIFAVSAGLSSGSRTDYLYEHLELLISAVLDSGYDIVTIKQLYTR